MCTTLITISSYIAVVSYSVENVKMTNTKEQSGRQLHQEFVGILFALAIAEVAVQASGYSGVDLRDSMVAYSHLVLAAMTIAASWVGWGQSSYRLSNISSLFSKDFVLLAVDVLLVVLYFFLARGVEPLTTPPGGGTAVVPPSLANEKALMACIFVTYVFWDLVTKSGKENGHCVVVQRGWASVVCAIMAIALFVLLPESAGVPHVVAGDVAFLSLVLLFRAMKVENLNNLSRSQWWLIIVLFTACLLAADSSGQFTCVGRVIMSVFPSA